MNYRSIILADTPTVYYEHEDDGVGFVALDASGNGLDGIYAATGVTYEQPGPLASETSKAVTFDGATGQMSYLTLATTDRPTYPFCLESWCNPNSVADNDVVVLVRSTDGEDGAILSVGPSALVWAAFIFQLDDSDEIFSGTAPLVDAVYQHLFARFVSATERYLYQDGAQIAGGAGLSSVPWTGTRTTNYELLIGTSLPGSVSRVAYYNHDVSPEQIKLHYTNSLQGFRLYDAISNTLLSTSPIADRSFDLSTLNLAEGRWELAMTNVDQYGCESVRSPVTANIGSGGAAETELRAPIDVRATPIAGGAISLSFGIEPSGSGFTNPSSFQVAYQDSPVTVTATITFDVTLARYSTDLPALADGITKMVIVRSTDGASQFSPWVKSHPVVTDSAGPPAPALTAIDPTVC